MASRVYLDGVDELPFDRLLLGVLVRGIAEVLGDVPTSFRQCTRVAACQYGAAQVCARVRVLCSRRPALPCTLAGTPNRRISGVAGTGTGPPAGIRLCHVGRAASSFYAHPRSLAQGRWLGLCRGPWFATADLGEEGGLCAAP